MGQQILGCGVELSVNATPRAGTKRPDRPRMQEFVLIRSCYSCNRGYFSSTVKSTNIQGRDHYYGHYDLAISVSFGSNNCLLC